MVSFRWIHSPSIRVFTCCRRLHDHVQGLAGASWYTDRPHLIPLSFEAHPGKQSGAWQCVCCPNNVEFHPCLTPSLEPVSFGPPTFTSFTDSLHSVEPTTLITFFSSFRDSPVSPLFFFTRRHHFIFIARLTRLLTNLNPPLLPSDITRPLPWLFPLSRMFPGTILLHWFLISNKSYPLSQLFPFPSFTSQPFGNLFFTQPQALLNLIPASSASIIYQCYMAALRRIRHTRQRVCIVLQAC